VSVWYFVHVGIDLMSSNEGVRGTGIYGELIWCPECWGCSWDWGMQTEIWKVWCIHT
jgi:hypothetical protein